MRRTTRNLTLSGAALTLLLCALLFSPDLPTRAVGLDPGLQVGTPAPPAVTSQANPEPSEGPSLTSVTQPGLARATPSPSPGTEARISSLKELTDLILNILAIVGVSGLAGVVGWLVWQWWRRRLAVEEFPFEIITDPNEVLKALLPGQGPLAHHAIPYQERNAKRNITKELREALQESRYLLVHAPTGLGKTREVGELARQLCLEQATVLVLQRAGWLDVPRDWPDSKLGQKDLVFVIDDITFHCAGRTQHPKAEEMITIGLPSFQERLACTLDYFEDKCGAREIRVLATARDEPEYWERLDFSGTLGLWDEFSCYPLAEPDDEAVIALLEEAGEQAGVRIDPDELPLIAATNDRTFVNPVVNLEMARLDGRALTLSDYRPSAKQTWESSYRQAIRKHPAAVHVYDALDLLAQAGVAPHTELVTAVGTRLWGGRWPMSVIHRIQVGRALEALVLEHVLSTRDRLIRASDGQVEGKGTLWSWRIITRC